MSMSLMKVIKQFQEHYVVILLSVALVLVSSILLHVFFAKDNISNLTVEILAAALAAVLVVVSVAVTIHFQNRAEMEREFNVKLFEEKISMYKHLLATISKIDDDSVIQQQELEEVRNISLTVALVGNETLIAQLVQFIDNATNAVITRTNTILRRTTDSGSFADIVSAMRADLQVVDDNDKKTMTAVGEKIKKLLATKNKIEQLKQAKPEG